MLDKLWTYMVYIQTTGIFFLKPYFIKLSKATIEFTVKPWQNLNSQQPCLNQRFACIHY